MQLIIDRIRTWSLTQDTMRVTWEVPSLAYTSVSLTSHPLEPKECSNLSPNSCHLLWLHSHRRRIRIWHRKSHGPYGTPWHTLCTRPRHRPFCKCGSGTWKEEPGSESGSPQHQRPGSPARKEKLLLPMLVHEFFLSDGKSAEFIAKGIFILQR